MREVGVRHVPRRPVDGLAVRLGVRGYGHRDAEQRHVPGGEHHVPRQRPPGPGVPGDLVALEEADEHVDVLAAGPPHVAVRREAARDGVALRLQVGRDPGQALGERGRLVRLERDDDVEVVVVGDQGLVPHGGEHRAEPEAHVRGEGAQRLHDLDGEAQVAVLLGVGPEPEAALRAVDGPEPLPRRQEPGVHGLPEAAPVGVVEVLDGGELLARGGVVGLQGELERRQQLRQQVVGLGRLRQRRHDRAEGPQVERAVVEDTPAAQHRRRDDLDPAGAARDLLADVPQAHAADPQRAGEGELDPGGLVGLGVELGPGRVVEVEEPRQVELLLVVRVPGAGRQRRERRDVVHAVGLDADRLQVQELLGGQLDPQADVAAGRHRQVEHARRGEERDALQRVRGVGGRLLEQGEGVRSVGDDCAGAPGGGGAVPGGHAPRFRNRVRAT